MKDKLEQTVHGGGTELRSSNLELLRILSMLAIIAHHYVVNSGITEQYDYVHVTQNMIFLQFWGMWGKTAINSFILISGYFMCTKALTIKRYLKVFLETIFYKYLIFIVLLIAGYEQITAVRLFNLLFGYFRYANGGGNFTSSFLMFYLFVPFYNLLIERMKRGQHAALCALLFFWYTICGTFFLNGSVFGEVTWFMVLYFIAAYVRLYPCRWTESWKFALILLLASLVLAYASVVTVDFVGVKLGFHSTYYMVADCHKFLAFTTSLAAFILFKNWKMPYSRLINSAAATAFGVLCIHASSDAMRTWLWKDFLKVPTYYTAPLPQLVMHAALSVVGIYVICSLIDCLRIRFIERPVMNWIEQKQGKIINKVSLMWNKVLDFI